MSSQPVTSTSPPSLQSRPTTRKPRPHNYDDGYLPSSTSWIPETFPGRGGSNSPRYIDTQLSQVEQNEALTMGLQDPISSPQSLGSTIDLAPLEGPEMVSNIQEQFQLSHSKGRFVNVADIPVSGLQGAMRLKPQIIKIRETPRIKQLFDEGVTHEMRGWSSTPYLSIEKTERGRTNCAIDKHSKCNVHRASKKGGVYGSEFEVRRIIGYWNRSNGEQYLVWWKGYRKDESTWEPLEHLGNAMRLVDRFRRQNRRRLRSMLANVEDFVVIE